MGLYETVDTTWHQRKCRWLNLCTLPNLKTKQTVKQIQTQTPQQYQFTQDSGCTLHRDHNSPAAHAHLFQQRKTCQTEKSSSSTKCHFWHIVEGSKCLDSCFRNKPLKARDDETKQIWNYPCTAWNLLSLPQPGALPSPREKAGRDQRKYRKGIAAGWLSGY